MRFTAVLACRTLLVVAGLFWTAAEDVFPRDRGRGPCAATLTPQGPCTARDRSTCPYSFSLPPLTVHLPEQLRQLQKIIEDVQRLKDSVDHLRRTCTGCTGTQSGSECAKGREDEEDSVGRETDGGKGVEKKTGGAGDCGPAGTTLEDRGRRTWEEDGAREGKEKPSPGGEGADPRTIVTGRNNMEADRDRKGDAEEDSKGREEEERDDEETKKKSTSEASGGENTEDGGRHMWQDGEGTETGREIHGEEDTGPDGDKMSEDSGWPTNKEPGRRGKGREEDQEEEEAEEDRGTKGQKNREGAGVEERGKGVQRDRDGEGTSRGAAEENLIPTTPSAKTRAEGPVSADSPPPLSTSDPITGGDQRVTLSAGPGRGPAPGRDITGTFTSSELQMEKPGRSRRPGGPGPEEPGTSGGAHSQDVHSATSATTEAPENFYATVPSEDPDPSRWISGKNASSRTKPGVEPLPSRGAKEGDKPEETTHDGELDKDLKLPKKRQEAGKDQPPQMKPQVNQKPRPHKDAGEAARPKHRHDDLHHNSSARQSPTKPTPKHHAHRTPDPNRSSRPVQNPGSNPGAVKVKATGVKKEGKTNQKSKQGKEPVRTGQRPKDPKKRPEKKTETDGKTESDQSFGSKQHLAPIREPPSEKDQAADGSRRPEREPEAELTEPVRRGSSPGPDVLRHSTPGRSPTPDVDHKTKSAQTPTRINLESESERLPKPKQKHLKPEADGEPDRPDPGPGPDPTSVSHHVPGAETRGTLQQQPHLRRTPGPGETPAEGPQAEERPEPTPEANRRSQPGPIGSTTSGGIQNTHSHVPSTPRPAAAGLTHPPQDTEVGPSRTGSEGPKMFNGVEAGAVGQRHAPPEGSTTSPSSRTGSDLKPQAAGRSTESPTTTRPGDLSRDASEGVLPRSGPGSADPDPARGGDLRARVVGPGGGAAPVPAPTTRAETSRLGSTGSGPEAPAVESTTPSARELRVKINQVPAFINISPSPDGGPPEELPGDRQGGRRSHLKPQSEPPGDCSDLLLRGRTESGVYLLTPDLRGRSFPAFCEMRRAGGGWTVIQRRRDGSVSFNRTWAEYRLGFGEPGGGEFWLGNGAIHLLTRDRDMALRVELEDFDGATGYAEYDRFRVASERLRFRLTVGGYSGTAGDALRFSQSYDHNDRAFTTPDRDHDRYPSGNCGAYYSSGWWFDACMAANLNGRYYEGNYKGVRDGIYWGTWHGIAEEFYPTNERRAFKAVRMMIRPRGFAP